LIIHDPMKTRINVMSFTSEVPYMIKKYVETHPEFARKYEVRFTQVTTDNGAYQSALDSALADEGLDYSPNLYMAEAAFVKKYTTGSASGYACTYEDLGIDVEQKIKDAKIAPYIADVTRRDGKVVSLGYQSNGCGFIYNREVAQDVFGDDRPETVQAALGSDWDSFFRVAEKCREKGYAIVSGAGDIWRPVENSADKGWVVDGKLYIDPKREAFLDYSKRLKYYDYHNDTWDWMEGWFADLGEVGPKRVLGFYGPAWFLNYTLTDHCGSTFGQWGVCRPNVTAFWGGTWLIANKNVLYNENLKAGVRELIEYITLDPSTEGLQYEWANAIFDYPSDSETKDSVASRVVMENSDGRMDILGGQDAFPIFIEAAEMARGDNLTEFDEWINMYWRDAVRMYTDGEISRDGAIEWFKRCVKENIEQITVE
ncbi:MAG: extracellular solute-binding protein, partial [Lachnospiraceae bacterium]|nr:extracellular solute-binding protein [Lachnospiraceae bacterium]